MNLIGYCLLFLTTFLIASCDYLSDEANNQVFTLVRSKENLLFQEIKIDTILVNHPNASYQGFFEYDEQGLYFFDKLFATVARFDKAGNHINSYLGKGQGPKEVPQIQNYLKIRAKPLYILWLLYLRV